MSKNLIYHINKVNKWLIVKNILNVNCEYTMDNSIFYTIVTEQYTFYLEIFLDDNNDQTVLNIFSKDKIRKTGYYGTLEKCLKQIDLKLNL